MSGVGALGKLLLPVIFALLGLAAAFPSTFLSGFALIQGDIGDSRFNNFLLEHSFRWLIGEQSLWSPPIFYPAQGALAFSDTLLSIAPIYWVPRLSGLDGESSYQVLIAALSLLNYGSFYLLTRRGLKFGILPSAAAAFLFAFGAPRLAHINRQQLFTQFFTVLCCYFLVEFYRAKGARDHFIFLLMAVSCLAAQAYS
ncbi:MAG: hypothetical protein DCC75_01490, partial [Proteobacteria bacterium]